MFANLSPLICSSSQTSQNLQSCNSYHIKLINLSAPNNPKGHETAKKEGGEVETIKEFNEVVEHKINIFLKDQFSATQRSFPSFSKVLRWFAEWGNYLLLTILQNATLKRVESSAFVGNNFLMTFPIFSLIWVGHQIPSF